LSKGLAVLRSEAREQFLDDGAHYELSPMYHNLCTEDYLDVLNLALANEGLVEPADIELFREICLKAIEYAVVTRLPDGGIALFNDSAFGVAPDVENLADYVEALFGHRPTSSGSRSIISYPETGVFGVRDRGTMWLVDCGPVSPAYQPGHSHCDMLSFELTVCGRRVVVDTGVHDYEDSEQRHYARSTRAHNTVAIAGHEQSELWGMFRIGRRARPLRATIEEDAEGVVFRGELRGFPTVRGGVLHHREIEHRWSGVFAVRDTVTGVDGLVAASYLHLHPDLEAVSDAGGVRVVDGQGGVVLEVEPGRGTDVMIESGSYFPEFGLERRNHVLVFTGTRAGQTLELGYALRFVNHALD
jgi:uncharacterized heparinase superfamily protein